MRSARWLWMGGNRSLGLSCPCGGRQDKRPSLGLPPAHLHPTLAAARTLTCNVPPLLYNHRSRRLPKSDLRHYSTGSGHFREVPRTPSLPDVPELNNLQILRFLRSRTIDYEETQADYRLQLPCYLFGPTIGQDAKMMESIETAALAVNKRTGSFVVPRLGIAGTWAELEALLAAWHHNRNTRRKEPKLDYPVLSILDPHLPQRLEAALADLTPVESLPAADYKDLLKHLRLYQCDFAVADFARLKARANTAAGQLVFPVRYIDGRIVGLRTLYINAEGQLAEKQRLERTAVAPAAGSGMLPFPLGLYDSVRESAASACILVGSVLDAVVLRARLAPDVASSYSIVVLPDPSTLHPAHIPFLDGYQTIILWLANDVQGAQNAQGFAQKIDEKRCRVVTSEFPSAFQCVRKKIDLTTVLKQSRLCYHEFLTTFDKMRDSVYLEFVQAEELLGVKWQRFDTLNATLGGFRRGELTIFSGRTGSGKTTFLSEYSLDLCSQGVNTLWCSFEVKNSRLLKMMLKQFSLINLDEHLDEFERVADRFARLPLYLTDFHGSQRVERVHEAMSHAVYVHDISHVIVDNMQFMLGAQGGGNFGGGQDRFAVQDNVIEMFRRFATSHNCHVTLVIHPRKESEEILTVESIFGGAKATQEADNVLLLQEERNPHAFFKKKYIQVVKNRYAGDLGLMPLVFSKSVLSFSKKVADQQRREAAKLRKPAATVVTADGTEHTGT